MKILHLVPYLPVASGVTTFIVEMTDELQRQGVSCAIAVRDQSRFEVAPSAVDVPRLSTREAMAKLSTFDVLHIHGIWPPFMHRFATAARRRGMPTFWSLHGMLSPWAMHHKWWKKVLPWCLWQKGDLAHADMLHVTSLQEEAWVRNCGLTNPTCTIPLGTTVPPDLPVRNHEVKTLLFVGRINPVKGLENLIHAWTKLAGFEPARNWRICLVGNDEAHYQDSLKQLVHQFRLEDKILFLGPRYGKNLEHEYRMADAFILPSYTENFGVVVLDALSWGLPVIASKATPWSVLEGTSESTRCGWWGASSIEEFVASIKELICTPDEKMRQIRECARHLVEADYAWPVLARRLENFYRTSIH